MLQWLRMVEEAAANLEGAIEPRRGVRGWLDACADWMWAVTNALCSALPYSGDARRRALAIALEESSLRVSSRLDREASAAIESLRVRSPRAARAAVQLAACVHHADRMLDALATRR